jgi:serine/threonine-protein kinase
MATFRPGDRFLHYVVGRLLGEGYHGEVYEIAHVHTGDVFALKVMHLADREDPRKVQRALSTAKGSYRVEHANVLSVLDLNCEDDGLVWMRTELLAGESLAELYARLGRLSPWFALSAGVEAAHGLQAVHEAQMVHRDVKPANLFYVSTTRALKVIDFSIAKVFPDGLSTTAGRRAGLGTLAYMAPEQLEGAAPTPAFDIYGLGMTLWQMLAGRHAFEEALTNTQELTRKQLVEMPPSLSDAARLPPEVDAVVRRAVAKDPRDRYRSASEMARALADVRALLAGLAEARRIAIMAPPGEPPPPGDPRSRRDYSPPATTPPGDAPAPAPSARVLVSAPGLRETTPAGGPRARSTPVVLPMPVKSSPWTPVSTPGPAIAAPAPARAPAPRRVRWSVVVLVLVLVSVSTLAITWALWRNFVFLPRAESGSPPRKE